MLDKVYRFTRVSDASCITVAGAFTCVLLLFLFRAIEKPAIIKQTNLSSIFLAICTHHLLMEPLWHVHQPLSAMWYP
jgi:hypothetical protein